MPKFLLSGTFYSGKSTLINELKRRNIKGCSFVDEVAREILEKEPGLEKRPEFQDILFAEQLRREKEAQSINSPLVVCDRGSFDIISYSRLFGHAVKQEWLDWCRTYDVIYLFNKNDVPFSQEIIREKGLYDDSRDWIRFRNDVDEHFFQVAQELGLPFKILSGSLEERLHIVERELLNFRSRIEFESSRKEGKR